MPKNQRLKELYYDRARRGVCVVCESKVLVSKRLCVNCLERDRQYAKKHKEGKAYHSNKLATKYNTWGIVLDKNEKAVEMEIR